MFHSSKSYVIRAMKQPCRYKAGSSYVVSCFTGCCGKRSKKVTSEQKPQGRESKNWSKSGEVCAWQREQPLQRL